MQLLHFRMHPPVCSLVRPILLLIVMLGSIPATNAASTSGTNAPSVVRVVDTGDGYTLEKNGEPYIIKGVGGSSNLGLLKHYGGNTIRTWDAEGIRPLLDEAHELGISVLVGIWLHHQRHGYDHDDTSVRREQIERVERFVRAFRDHPAVLGWGVGNEVELGGALDIAIEQINAAAKKIKELDPDHPTFAIIAGTGEDKARRIAEDCPDIDVLGINAYGSVGGVTQDLARQGYDGPYAITEYGPLGHWESAKTPWGAPIEQSSAEKAAFLKKNHAKTVEANLDGPCIGSFAFLWGHKQERTETWYGLVLPTGETTQSVDVLSEFWTGDEPKDLAPRVEGMTLHPEGDRHRYAPGTRVRCRVHASEPDADRMDIEWRVFPESDAQTIGGDPERTLAQVETRVQRAGESAAWITLPETPGAYRIFVTVRDGNGHAGTANTPVLIERD